MTEAEKDILFNQIYTGVISLNNLPEYLYVEYATAFNASLFIGYGRTLDALTLGTAEYDLVFAMKNNLNIFSGVKTFDHIRMSQELIFDSRGALRPFNDYLNDVKKVYEIHNKTWLKTERDLVVGQSQQARNWMDIEADKEVLEMLEYVAVMDARTREDHAALDGIVKPVDDPFWKNYAPKNGYNCRCTIIQRERGEKRETKKLSKEQQAALKDIDPLFKMNPAKDGYIFKTEGKGVHPYFKVPEAFEVDKNRNFGFPNI